MNSQINSQTEKITIKSIENSPKLKNAKLIKNNSKKSKHGQKNLNLSQNLKESDETLIIKTDAKIAKKTKSKLPKILPNSQNSKLSKKSTSSSTSKSILKKVLKSEKQPKNQLEKQLNKLNYKNSSDKKFQKKILILSWEIFPLFAGGLGFLTKSAVDELIRQNSEVIVLVPSMPKNMTINNTESLEKRTKFWLKKNKPIPNLNFELNNFGQKKTNQMNWPPLFSDKKLKNNKKFNIYPQNTPAITKAFAWSVLEFVRNNELFDLIIGMDWESIPSFYVLEDYFDKLNQKSSKLKATENNFAENCPKNVFENLSQFEQQKVELNMENLEKKQIENKIKTNLESLEKIGNEQKRPKNPKFYFYINATELDRGPEQINQKETKNPILDLEKATYKQASKIISISDITRDILVNHYQVKPEKILTVYNDITFEPNFDKFSSLMGGKNVLFIGRIESQKGLIFLLETAVRVLEIDSQVKFFVAGDGDLLPSLVENICEKGLEKSFFLTGWLGEDDKKRLYSSCDLFVMPSPSEPFGLTPLEAIRSDTAVISSQTCGFLSVVPSTPTFAYHDINNFAQLIIYYLHNPNERNKLLETQKMELAKHSWTQEIAKILNSLNL